MQENNSNKNQNLKALNFVPPFPPLFLTSKCHQGERKQASRLTDRQTGSRNREKGKVKRALTEAEIEAVIVSVCALSRFQ